MAERMRHDDDELRKRIAESIERGDCVPNVNGSWRKRIREDAIDIAWALACWLPFAALMLAPWLMHMMGLW